jgi:hypothetical protein
MGNNTPHHPLVDLPRNKPINLNKLIPKKEWWSIWHYIFSGKMVEVKKQ